jgi:D-serine dehydratase
MPEVNPVDYETAVEKSLKNGTTDYSELLGPDWRKRLSALSEQVNEIRDLGLPLSILEAKSGGIVDNKNEVKGA